MVLELKLGLIERKQSCGFFHVPESYKRKTRDSISCGGKNNRSFLFLIIMYYFIIQDIKCSVYNIHAVIHEPYGMMIRLGVDRLGLRSNLHLTNHENIHMSALKVD